MVNETDDIIGFHISFDFDGEGAESNKSVHRER